MNQARKTKTMKGWGIGLASGLLATMAAAGGLEAQFETRFEAEAPIEVRFVDYGNTQEVEGDEVYSEARAALNRRDYQRAIILFRQLRESYPSSVLVGDSYYYQAFALYRMANDQNSARARDSYMQAVELIETQASEHSDAATRRDAESLMARIDGAMARSGDAEARAAVSRRAQVACDDEENETRAMALSALMNMDPERAGPLLREIIADRDECNGELRAQAVFILAQNDDEDTVDLLLDIAHRNPDPDPEVRSAAVFWLSQVDRPEAVDALLAVIEAGGDDELMGGALFALSQHDDPRAFDALINILETSPNDELRAQAIFAVTQHGIEEVGPLLRRIALDESEDPEVRGQAIFWLGQHGGSLNELQEIFRAASDREVKNQAIFAISQLDTSESVDFLMEVARGEDNDEIRQQAIFWLGQSDDPRVAQFLLDLIRR